MSWISELIRQKKYLVGPQKLRSIGPRSQNFSIIVPMSLKYDIFSVFKQSQESKNRLKIFEYIRKILRIFEYIRDKKIYYSYSNIRYSAENIRIYSNIRHALVM